MRYILLLPLVVTLLVSCTKTDKEMLTDGTWSLKQRKEDGRLTMSVDPKDQKEILDRAWKEQGAIIEQMGMSKEMLADNIKKEGEMYAKITFQFKEDGKVKVSANDGKTKDTNSPYKMDDKKKEIVIEEPNAEKLSYKYVVSEDELILKMEKNELVFTRKD